MKRIFVLQLRVNRKAHALRVSINAMALYGVLSFLPTLSWAAEAALASQAAMPHAGSSQPTVVASQTGPVSSDSRAPDLRAWLQHISQAAKTRSYTGTFVVQSGGGRIVTSTIDHYVVHGSMLERVETMDGERRILLCHNAKTRTILPDARLIVVDDAHADFSFPRMLRAPSNDVSDFYRMEREGHERCAGYVCNITRIKPRDDLRYGYRLWTERSSGLLVKAQTLDDQEHVLDQVAFTQLTLNPKPQPNLITQALQGTGGYQVEHMHVSPTTAKAQGWTQEKPVPGFDSVGIYQRQLVLRGKPVEVTQWLFSDGLASVSLFAGPSTDTQHQGASLHMGDTNALLARKGAWSVIVVGAVPDKTLQLFADSVARLH